MKIIKQYKNNLKTIFFSSVSNDLEKWERIDSKWDYKSPNYLSSDNKKIYFRTNEHHFYGRVEVECDSKIFIKICTYKWLCIPIDFKVRKYVKKIKKSIKEKEYYDKNKKHINDFKFVVDNLSPIFVKEIRKEKLKNIKNEN